MKFCSKCGVGLEDDAKVCFNCGAPLEPQKSDEQPMLFGGTEVSLSDKKEKQQATQKEKQSFPIWIPIVAALAVIVLVVGVVLMTSGGNADDKGSNGDVVADNNGSSDNQNDDNNGNDDTDDNDDKKLPSYFDGPDVPDEVREYLFYNESSGDEVVELGTPATALDPQKVYDTVKYIPEMFYGEYEIEDFESKEDAYRTYLDTYTNEDIGYGEDYLYAGNEYVALPMGMAAGPHSTRGEILYSQTGLHWATLSYGNVLDGVVGDVLTGYYEIDGNIFRFTPVRDFEYDESLCKYVFEVSDYIIEYEFEFNGPYLTFSKNGQSVTLLANGFHEKSEYSFMMEPEFDCYLDYYSTISFDSIFRMDSYTIDGERSFYLTDINGYWDKNAKLRLTTDGLFTLTWTDGDGKVVTIQLVYFFCGKDGLVLTNGTHTVCYTYDYSDYDDMFIEGNIDGADSDKLEEMEEEEMEAIIEKKADLLKDLAAAYEAAGMNVQINEVTGEIALDSTVLFGVDQSSISAEGKTFLSKFIDIYCDVVFDPKYEDFVSKIMVEGHTDTTGTYERNQTLSQERADSVKNYCLSAVNSTYVDELTDMMISAGFAYTKPIYDANGDVDMDASRRVAFRFLISLE